MTDQERQTDSVAEEMQAAMDATWDEGEFSTDHLGTSNGQWYTWSSNGGTKGAHDRMDGSGRWVECYEMPAEVSLETALEWLISRERMTTDEALDAMAEADTSRHKADLVRDIGECEFVDGSVGSGYVVRGDLYVIDNRDVSRVDPTEADTDHETARDRYWAYGWHLPTETGHDVSLQAVEYDWLDDADDDVVADRLARSLASQGIEATEDEVITVVARARLVREAAEQVESHLDAAVEAYGRHDYAASVESLDEAASIEEETGGDAPASQTLRDSLFGGRN